MRAGLPPAPAAYESSYFTRAFAALDRILGVCVTRQEAVDSVLLQAPDNSVWKVTVDNSGNLVTTSVALGQNGAPNF
jgi:hypothetical protein